MIPDKKYYMCDSFYAIVEAITDTEIKFRLSSIRSIFEVQRAMTKYRFVPDNWYQPNSNHPKPISSFWIYRK